MNDFNVQESVKTLNGSPVSENELNEARSNPSIKIVEDKNNPNNYKTLHRMYS